MTNPVEAMARAMYERQTSVLIAGPFENQSVSRQTELRADARAALQALKDNVSEEMVEAYYAECGRDNVIKPRGGFDVMISAAMEDEADD